MSKFIKDTYRQFKSDVINRANEQNIAIEDSYFLTFTQLLDDADIFINPKTSRTLGTFKNKKFSLFGYSASSFNFDNEDDVDGEDEEITDLNKFELKWNYTLFNGQFEDDSVKIEPEKLIKQTLTFLEKTFSKDYLQNFSEANELQKQLNQRRKDDSLNKIEICIICDSIFDYTELPKKKYLENYDIEVRIHYWDFKRWCELKRNKNKRESIIIDFVNDIDYRNYSIPFLEKQIEPNYKYYLAIFPADLLGDLYYNFDTKLLENNVRVFLSATQKANKGIRDTIKKDAIKFFSYNNGISATAEFVEIINNKIVKIKDFQIVNGGQTTASIHYARKKDGSSLKDVYVPVKITALQNNNNYSEIVDNISRAANTQSAISQSDFFANSRDLIMLEQLSLKTPVLNDNDTNVYYFFERMKGQYNVTMSNQGRESLQRAWQKSYPKELMFNKIDVARWYNILYGLPYVAATGAEKQFKDFMDNKNFKRPNVSLGKFKTLIGLGLLFKRIKKLCGTANGNQYPSLTIDFRTKEHVPVAMSTAIYTTAYLHQFTKERFDYWSIFEYKHGICQSILTRQRFDTKLDELLIELINECWKQIYMYGGAAAQERSKTIDCWNYVIKNINLSKNFEKNINKYIISDKEYKNRSSEIIINDDYDYFNSLDSFLKGECFLLKELLKITNTNRNYLNYKDSIKNILKRIDSTNEVLPKTKILEIFSFYQKLLGDGIRINTNNLASDTEINFIKIYEIYFKTQSLSDIDLIEERNTLLNNADEIRNELQDIIDLYFSQNGLSLTNLQILNNR
jgi:hypothetical protein